MRYRGILAATAVASAVAVSGVRIRRSAAPPRAPSPDPALPPRGSTLVGISYRPLQAEAFGLDALDTLHRLLRLPFDIIRIPAYWNRIDNGSGGHAWQELDAHVDAATTSGKQIILGVGAVKNFGYPEVFVPLHHLDPPLHEGTRIDPATHSSLCGGACDFVTQVVERYRGNGAIVAWQVEHEAVDPLGMEHSWRLTPGFVRAEVSAVRSADSTRPVLMNGFLPTSLPVRLQQWWRTRDQGDSLDVALRVADIVGIDHYPRHALARAGRMSVYLDGTNGLWDRQRRHRLLAFARRNDRTLMVSEAQAEPWEAVTTPPSPPGRIMSSCGPADVVDNYRRWITWANRENVVLSAYLFWGAEYWILREQSGDASYLHAIELILDAWS